MNIAVSPYHLTTREPPAMASLALARSVVTVLPGTGDASDTARTLPAFSRFMKSWTWTVPLWKAGLLTTDYAGQALESDIWQVTQHISNEPACLPLRHFLQRHECIDQRAYLTALANDLMKGGPDPGISLPVAAGLDRFAARRRIVVARAAPTSLSQRAECSLSTAVVGLVVPIFVQATAQRILHYREVLADEVARLGAACERIAAGLDNAASLAPLIRDAKAAAASLAGAFERSREELFLGSADDEVRPIEGAVSLSAVALPWDAVLTSSVRAVESLAPMPALTGAGKTPGSPAVPLPALRDELAGRTFLSMIVRPLGHSPVHA